MTAEIYYLFEPYRTSGPKAHELQRQKSSPINWAGTGTRARHWTVTGPQPAEAHVDNLTVKGQACVFRSLAWLVKLGVPKVCS